MVLNPGSLNWEPSNLTTRPLLHNEPQELYTSCLAPSSLCNIWRTESEGPTCQHFYSISVMSFFYESGKGLVNKMSRNSPFLDQVPR